MPSKRGNGEGSIFKRKDGTWCSVVTNGRDKAGKLKRVYYYGKTRQEVAEKSVKAQNEIKTGLFVEPSRMKVGDWIDTWLKEYMKTKLRITTYSSYECFARVHIKPAIGETLLRDLRPEQLQSLYNEKFATGRHDEQGGLSSRSVRYIHIIIHGALEQAVKNRLLSRNISDATTLPRQKKKDIQVMSLEGQYKFQDTLEGERLGTAFKLDLASGLRLGELLALRWQEVNLEKGYLQVKRSMTRVKVFNEYMKSQIIIQEPKTKSGNRNIPLPKSIIEEILIHKEKQEAEKAFAGAAYEDNGLLFCTELGKPIERRNFIRKFSKLLEKAKVEKINFHALRHTFATRALENKMNPKVLQEILGHSTITLTMDLYSHVMPEYKKSSIDEMDYLYARKKAPQELIEEADKKAPTEVKTRRREKVKSKGMEMEL